MLHWSLPRPVSDAECLLSAELEVLSSKQQALCAAWSTMRRGVEDACDERRTQQQQQQGGVGSKPPRSPLLETSSSIPPAQLSKVCIWLSVCLRIMSC